MGQLVFQATLGGQVAVSGPNTASSYTLTLPTVTDTIATLTSPTFVTPALGTPTSGLLSNCTGLPLTTGVSGTLGTSNGGTGLTSVGSAGTYLSSNGSSLSYVSPAVIVWQSVQTSNFSATAGNGYPVNTTTGAITVTLPSSPSAGNVITLTDYAGKWATNNVTIAVNGNKLDGVASNATLSTNRQSISLVYIDATQGWITYSGFLGTIPNQSYTASYLIVAGGGSSAHYVGGGGGAGGYLTGTLTLQTGTVYTAVVGAGGAAEANGSNSTFPGVTTAVGGGIGGTGGYGTSGTLLPTSGGSGGGGGAPASPGAATAGGSGTPGQGNSGGSGFVAPGVLQSAGGGGAGAAGANATPSNGTAGGVGLASSITGTPAFYAGGGGAASGGSLSGGTGGGGTGAAYTGGGTVSVAGTNGTANTGGGSGGGGGPNAGPAATSYSGGSGVVILSVPTANYSGTTTGSPTITTSGSNTIIKWTTGSGTYTA